MVQRRWLRRLRGRACDRDAIPQLQTHAMLDLCHNNCRFSNQLRSRLCFYLRCRKALSTPITITILARGYGCFYLRCRKALSTCSGDLIDQLQHVFLSPMPKGVEHSVRRREYVKTDLCFYLRCRKALSTRGARAGRHSRLCVSISDAERR